MNTHELDGSAEVRAHQQVIRYRRSGAGPLVLVLGTDCLGERWDELAGPLAQHFRLVAPDLSCCDGVKNVVGMAAAMLEGLGASRVGVIAAGNYCGPAVELVREAAGQVTHVVLIPWDEDRPVQSVMEHRPMRVREKLDFAGAKIPLLVLPQSLPPVATLGHVTQFLREGHIQAGRAVVSR